MGVPSSQAKRANRTDLLLSLALIPGEIIIGKKKNNKRRKNSNGMFECKTCNREFSSFQALGGHCTSHLRPKVRCNGIDLEIGEKHKEPTRHVCGLCAKEFLTGQALGGHMRLHRASLVMLAVRRSQHPEDKFGVNVFPKLTNDKLGFHIDEDVASTDHELCFPGRLLNLFE